MRSAAPTRNTVAPPEQPATVLDTVRPRYEIFLRKYSVCFNFFFLIFNFLNFFSVQNGLVPWQVKVEAVKKPHTVCDDHVSECPSGTMCCKYKNGQWGCCPFTDVSSIY